VEEARSCHDEAMRITISDEDTHEQRLSECETKSEMLLEEKSAEPPNENQTENSKSSATDDITMNLEQDNGNLERE
jgi:hypothetical protein